ncbi:ABC transporter substrate-binding protein [Labrenzia sp. PHM005]|uniref:substrate-binding periplasmic protein n=1 Tax=Labrenzia sp. PHM005 TaxID=2590016 RepID=UPI00113FCE96|nr:transporter substrate-binding domain-containing protein [Labrenzia sp. PHM005]QDG75122.1 hypothetical protein FJ695_04175 [Labrenzia sp. PHM005]
MKIKKTLLAILLVLPNTTAKSVLAEQFSFAIGEWPPFVSETLPGGGLHSKKIADVFGSQGHEVSFQFFPWRRSMELTKTGTFPATFSWSHLQEREVDYQYPKQPVDELNDVYFYRKDRFPAGLTPMSFDELKSQSLTVVGVGGYWYETVLKKHGVVFQIVATEEQAWKMLLHGRADIYIENDISGDIQKRQFLSERAEEITRSQPFRTIPLYILFSRKHPDAPHMMKIWDDGMTKLSVSGSNSETQ